MNSDKHCEAQLVQILGQSMTNPGITTCKESRQDKSGLKRGGREKLFNKETQNVILDGPHSQEKVSLEETSLFAKWEMDREVKTDKFLCLKRRVMREKLGQGHTWKEEH